MQQVGIIRTRDNQARFRSSSGRPLIDSLSAPARQLRKDAAANRESVLDAATELVRRDGEKVPMATIARHAGVGVGTVCRHFPTREDLLGALVHRSFGLAVDNARAAAAQPGSALDGIRLFFLATLRDRDRFVLPLHGGRSSSPLPRASARRTSAPPYGV